MDEPDPAGPDPELTPDPATRPRPGPPWLLPALGGLAALVLVIGLIVWATRGGDEITSGTTVPIVPDVSTTSAPTDPSTSVGAPTSTASTPSTTSATTSSTEPSTTAPAPAGPTGASWTVTSPFFPDDPFTMSRVAAVGGVTAYDGEISPSGLALRCVAVVVDGRDGWREWCGEAGQPQRFLVLDGIEPWVVQLGTASGDVTLARQEPTWTLPSNGCAAPVATLVAPAPNGPAAFTGVVCVPGEAFAMFSQVLLQPGPADGGGVLLGEGDEGWDVIDVGTSIACAGWPDGVDRCALFDVDDELFEASLPIPPIDLLSASTDIIGVTDRTADVRLWVGGEQDPATVQSIVETELIDTTAEVAPTVLSTDVLWSGLSRLVVIEIPAQDDSILSETWAVWIRTGDGPPSAVMRATSWTTCARGLATPDTCI